MYDVNGYGLLADQETVVEVVSSRWVRASDVIAARFQTGKAIRCGTGILGLVRYEDCYVLGYVPHHFACWREIWRKLKG